MIVGDFTLTHGSPRDPVWEYILRPGDASENLPLLQHPFCLVGHTHVPALFRPGRRAQDRTPDADRQPRVPLLTMCRVILNPGSVGQPRDSDPRVAYAILDTES